jgi:hypothetical protein
MRHDRRNAPGGAKRAAESTPPRGRAAAVGASVPAPQARRSGLRTVGRQVQREAWQWATTNRAADGSLPTGKAIAAHFGRHERWGRLVKRSGVTMELSQDAEIV